jgi:hypothetical protein
MLRTDGRTVNLRYRNIIIWLLSSAAAYLRVTILVLNGRRFAFPGWGYIPHTLTKCEQH